MHSCEICGRRYRRNFRTQYGLHKNQKASTCKVCQDDLNQRLLLNELPIHTEAKPFSLKCMSNLTCQEQNFLIGHNTTRTEHTLNIESDVVLGNLNSHVTPPSRDNKPPSLEDYILPTKPTKIENGFHFASSPKLELIVSLARVKHEKVPHFSTTTTGGDYALTNNHISVQTDNLEFNDKPLCTFSNAQSVIENKNSLASISILHNLLTKPVEDVHNKSLPPLPNEFGVPTIHSSILRSRLINNVNTKNSVTSISILESLLTKPTKNDRNKCIPILPNKIKNEEPSVPTSLLKCLLLASKTKNEPIPPKNTEIKVESKTLSRNLFKVVDVVSLAGELHLSNASATANPQFANDRPIFFRAPRTLTKSNSAEVIHSHHHLLPSTVNSVEFLLPTDFPKCQNSISFQNAFGESGIHEIRKRAYSSSK